MSILGLLQRWGSFVAFSHTVFALPFALSVLVIYQRTNQVTLAQFFFILLCLVSARTAAMSWNRIVDRSIDAANARTAGRALPRGILGLFEAYGIAIGAVVLFLISAWALGTHCLMMAPVVLAILFGYSFAKRFTSLSHVILGVALSLAPGGVWCALTGDFSVEPLPLMVAVALWVAGFDILYSCQDAAFDRSYGLYSIPAKFGVARALQVAYLLHGGVPLLLLLYGVLATLGSVYFVGVAIFTLVLLSQHRLVTANDFSKVNQAFFFRNGVASLLFFGFVVIDSLVS